MDGVQTVNRIPAIIQFEKLFSGDCHKTAGCPVCNGGKV
jgi:hypothetical protein